MEFPVRILSKKADGFHSKKGVFLGRVRPQLEAAAVDLQIDLQIQVGLADGIGILQ